MEANALAGADTITLPAGTYTLSIPGAGEDAGDTGDLDITDDLTIDAGQGTSIIDDSATVKDLGWSGVLVGVVEGVETSRCSRRSTDCPFRSTRERLPITIFWAYGKERLGSLTSASQSYLEFASSASFRRRSIRL